MFGTYPDNISNDIVSIEVSTGSSFLKNVTVVGGASLAVIAVGYGLYRIKDTISVKIAGIFGSNNESNNETETTDIETTCNPVQ